MKTKAPRPIKNKLKKQYGINPKRITNEKGERVWVVKGKEYKTLQHIALDYKVD